jgi:mono/diheme cytochrome c family protein
MLAIGGVVAALAVLTDIGAMAQTVGDPAKGQRFALQVCTPCHLVAPDQLSPPRFALAPSFEAIANTRAMTESALAAFLYSPHPNMPNIMLTRDEAADVIAYILTLKRKP